MADQKSIFIEVNAKFIDSIDIPDHLFEPTFLLDLPNGIHRHKISEPLDNEVDTWFVSQGAKPGEVIYIEVDY